MGRLLKRVRQIIARTHYYGIGYPMDYLMVACGKRKGLRTVEKKEKTYPNLQGQARIDELAKWFYASTGEKMDFCHPATFNQKLQWCKVFDRNPMKAKLADKYLVREWVAEKIGQEYLVPLLGVWDRFDDIDFSRLPDRFALKCNHGSGWNVIVDDKQKLNIEEAKRKFDRWMSEDYTYKAGFELHYGDITPRIIAEEYMENAGGDIYDYKFYCFDGEVKYVQFLMDRKHGLKMGYFDPDWKLQPFVNNHPQIDEDVPKPDNLDQMIRLAEILSAGFPYVRVDFYRLNDGTIRFGEMTFTPASGTQDWDPPQTNDMLGAMLRLPTDECDEHLKNGGAQHEVAGQVKEK